MDPECRVSITTIWVSTYSVRCREADNRGLQAYPQYKFDKSVMKEGYSAGQSDVVKSGKVYNVRAKGKVTLSKSPWPLSGGEGWVRVCT